MSTYQASIFDLRALTNYTFQVSVSQFLDKNSAENSHSEPSGLSGKQPTQINGTDRNSLGRSINFQDRANENSIRVETKAFSAEATKCLADVTEVTINTGKYFGGRISAEGDNLDPKCSLIGNKTSDQGTYSLKIDHELCKSKILEGNRIETMILVHENKDILTHNTARFLVVCNFQQKSYTVKASVSLPKVNGIGDSRVRPATVTFLASRPTNDATRTVKLGSMPGLYKARGNSTTSNTANNEINTTLPDAGKPLKNEKLLQLLPSLPANQLTDDNDDDVFGPETEAENAIERAARPESSMRRGERQLRQPRKQVRLRGEDGSSYGKQLNHLNEREQQQQQQRPRNGSSYHESSNYNNRARSLTLTDGRSLSAPAPVQVQSKVLYVERLPSALDPSGRSGQFSVVSGNIQAAQEASSSLPTVANASSSSLADKVQATQQAPANLHKTPAAFDRVEHHQPGYKMEPLNSASSDLQSTPVIMTNNHRVSGDFPPLAALLGKRGASAVNLADDESNYSIRYSALPKIEDYSIGAPSTIVPSPNNATQSPRGRSGRMQKERLDEQQQHRQKNDAPASDSPPAIQRMGEIDNRDREYSSDESPNDDSVSSKATTKSNSTSTTLAQNLTSYILRWSLKTLTNLAKKSFQVLAEPEQSATEPKYRDPFSSMSSHPEQSLSAARNHEMIGDKPRADLSIGDAQPTARSAEAKKSVITTAMPVVAPTFAAKVLQGNDSKSQSPDDKKPINSNTLRLAVKLKEKDNSSDRIDLSYSRPAVAAMNNYEQQVSRSNNSLIYVSWFLYGLALLLSLVTGVFLIVWLISLEAIKSRILVGRATKIKKTNSNRGFNDHHKQNPNIMSYDNPAVVWAGKNNNAGTIKSQSTFQDSLSSPTSSSSSYQKYDFSSGRSSADNSDLLSQSNGTAARHDNEKMMSSSLAKSVARADSTTNSKLIADENNCNNNEFLYSGHILINSGTTFDESYA